MSVSRYDKRKIIKNSFSLYEKTLEKRDVKFINQYTTPEIAKDILLKSKDFIYSYHIWAHGDRLYKLADSYYGDSKLWWVIGLINQKPTESHFAVGDLVLIPRPLEKVLEAYGL